MYQNLLSQEKKTSSHLPILKTSMPPPQHKENTKSPLPAPIHKTTPTLPLDIVQPVSAAPSQSSFPPLRHLLALAVDKQVELDYCLNFLDYLKTVPNIMWDKEGDLQPPYVDINIVDFVLACSKKTGPSSDTYLKFIKDAGINRHFIKSKRLKKNTEVSGGRASSNMIPSHILKQLSTTKKKKKNKKRKKNSPTGHSLSLSGWSHWK